MTQSLDDRIKSVQRKLKRETDLYNGMVKDLNVIIKFVKVHPKKTEIRVPFMGLVNVKDRVKFTKQKVLAQKREMNRYNTKLNKLRKMATNK